MENKRIPETAGDLATLPVMRDWLALVPGSLRRELTKMCEEAKELVPDSELQKIRVDTVRRKLEVLVCTSKTFCRTYLEFLTQQNEELRRIALAATGSYAEAIPPERGRYYDYNPWPATFDSKGGHGAAKFTLPAKEENAAAAVSRHVEQNILGYVNEFTANITRKGRLDKVEQFLDKFELDVRVSDNFARTTPFSPFLARMTAYHNDTQAQREWVLKRHQSVDTRMSYFVHKFTTDKAFRTRYQVCKCALPPDASENPRVLALHVFTMHCTAEDRDKIEDEFKCWREAARASAEGAYTEPTFDGLTGLARREAISVAIQSHLDRVQWLNTQMREISA